MASNAAHLMIYNNEDVSLGAWLAPFNIELRFDARFNTGGISRGCKKQFIVMHKIQAEQMYDYFNAVKKDRYICNRRTGGLAATGMSIIGTLCPQSVVNEEEEFLNNLFLF